MAVPVADVVDTKPAMQVIEEDLLPIRVGAEANRCPLRSRPGGNRERNHVDAIDQAPGKDPSDFGIDVLEAVRDDGGVRTVCE